MGAVLPFPREIERSDRAPRETPITDDAGWFEFPSLEDRVTINGRTGSGKTHAGAWLLSESEFHKQPFVIIDFKRDIFFSKIDRLKEIDFGEVPTKPGVFHLKALPDQTQEMEDWLWKVWKKTHIGLFVDEGYLIDKNSKAFRTILTTGRSLHIPVYTLSQRPVELPRFTISEASFYQSFNLHDKRDRDTVEQFTPKEGIWGNDARLPKFHSKWYAVSADFSCLLGPAPRAEHILQRFDERLKPRKRII